MGSVLMKLSSSDQVRAEVVASEGGRSLVMVNGRPVHVAGDYQAGQQINGQLAATDGGFKIIAADNSAGVSAEKLLQNAGLHEAGQALATAMKSYGVPVTGENLRLAAEIIGKLPQGAANLELVALLLARKLPIGAAPLLEAYLGGQLKFSGLFAALEKSVQTGLQASWGEGRLIERFLEMLRAGAKGEAAEVSRLSKNVDEWVAGLQLQEVFTASPDGNQEGRLYFQWPMFWHGQDIPDTLEGEAFIPSGSDKDQGFSLRILVNPPSLGQVEVALNQQQRSLWVHFGVSEPMLKVFSEIFNPIRESLIAEGDFADVRLTIGKVRLLNNFFSSREEPIAAKVTARIDLKA